MNRHTYAHEYTCACMTPSTRWSTDTETHNLCTNMHTHTYTHVYKCIHIHIHTHMHIHKYIHVRTHTHIHIYTHTRIKCTYARTQAHLEQRDGGDCARSWSRRRNFRTSLHTPEDGVCCSRIQDVDGIAWVPHQVRKCKKSGDNTCATIQRGGTIQSGGQDVRESGDRDCRFKG